MDSFDRTSSTYRCGPSRALASAAVLGAAIAAIGVAVTSDRPGQLLLACVAVVLIAIGGIDLIFCPRLTASAAGVAIFSPTVRVRLSWPEVEVLRVDERGHLGLASRALEIESGPLLVVLSKHGLGTDPRTAFERLQALRG